MKIARFAKYLGFMVGSEACGHAWRGPSGKLLKRARHVRSLGLSMTEARLAFKVFAVSVIRYTLQFVAPSLGLVRDFRLALDIALSSPRHALGEGILCNLRRLGKPCEYPHLDSVSSATQYRTAVRSEVLGDLEDLVRRARESDDAVLHPKHTEWMGRLAMSTLAANRERVRGLEGIDGLGGGPTFREESLRFLRSEARGDGDLLSVLAKRVGHFGFDRPGDRAVNFVCNMENASRVLKPFVLGSMIRTVCNAHATSRRFGGATGHTCCKFGGDAVGGDDIRNY